jgi:hypothetical protein
MNPELEELIQALDDYLLAHGAEAESRLAIYESKLDASVSAHSGVSRESLHGAVQSAYRRWRRKQDRPPTLPPYA